VLSNRRKFTSVRREVLASQALSPQERVKGGKRTPKFAVGEGRKNAQSGRRSGGTITAGAKATPPKTAKGQGGSDALPVGAICG